MPETNDIDFPIDLVHVIDNAVGTKIDFSGRRILEFGNGSPSFRKSCEGERLFDKRVAKFLSGFAVVSGDKLHNFTQILASSRRQDDFEVHSFTNFRASSTEIPSRR